VHRDEEEKILLLLLLPPLHDHDSPLSYRILSYHP
jgi:hypothetical protein